MRRVVWIFGAALLSLIVLTVMLTARYRSYASTVTPDLAAPISAGAAERLAGAIRIRTLSAEDPAEFDSTAFASLHAYLETAFPRGARSTSPRENGAT
jgi:carboxypeptidase PM20D1